MKKYGLLLAVLLGCHLLWAQGDSTAMRERHNEISFDATSFIVQFFPFDPNNPLRYEPAYFVGYRRYFKPGNIRAAIGGRYFADASESPFDDDPTIYRRDIKEVSARVGWEFKTDLGKRWQAFYGLDWRPQWTRDYNDASFWNGGYGNGHDTRVFVNGFAGLLGIRFRLNARISLMTEMSATLQRQHTQSRTFKIPVAPQYPPLPDEEVDQTTTRTFFSAPLSLYFAFTF